jgi:hypothetical protein
MVLLAEKGVGFEITQDKALIQKKQREDPVALSLNIAKEDLNG